MTTYAIEPWDLFWQDFQHLQDAHWTEAHPGDPHDPPWELWAELDRQGSLICVGARDGIDDRLIGYAVYLVGPDLFHRRRTVAQDIASYLVPDRRWGWEAARLFRAAEQLLGLNFGPLRIAGQTRVCLDRSPLFKRLGYEASDILFVKDI